jgi:hypothetical protein
VSAARELRDRYLEQVNTTPLLPPLLPAAKYDVGRALPAPDAGASRASRAASSAHHSTPALPAPIPAPIAA